MKLPGVLQATLDVIPRRPELSTQEIIERVGDEAVGVTAINNRLRGLERHGLIKNTRRRGKLLFWKRVN